MPHPNLSLFYDFVTSILSHKTILQEQDIDNAIQSVLKFQGFQFEKLTDEDIEELKKKLKSNISIKLNTGHLLEKKGHIKWFLERKKEIDMRYWDRYRTYLLNDKAFAIDVVNKMDIILDTLTDLLGDPSSDIGFNRKGLIIGDVQSGKTANYTGLICKAADAGYKVIVLLTGTIENLRRQTQQRLDEGFVGFSSSNIMKGTISNTIGVGKYANKFNPIVLTSTESDFRKENATNLRFRLDNLKDPVLFVIKKNSSVLQRLNNWFATFNQQNGMEEKISQPLLLIDDEADNASVNTRKTDEEPTKINKLIRELFHKFKVASYIGYTATPYANIFINPDTKNEMQNEDLFPSDYIYSLEVPTDYIGARNIFGKRASYRYMVKTINNNIDNPESIENILPLRHKKDITVSKLPSDLKESILTFILANTIEDINGLKNNHRTMLINVSRFVIVQEKIGTLVLNYLRDIQISCNNYSKLPQEIALNDINIKNLKKTYDKIYFNTVNIEWNIIQKNLYKSSAPITVKVVNQNTSQRLNYMNSLENGLRVIAIGGFTLSRGLTLEGLVISYFYRNSKMYDTIMQMGRWFGYRKNYENLCRIWMTDVSKNWYSYISEATDELRNDIKKYEDTGLTPLDFGLRVRSDLSSLIVTARNKMYSTKNYEIQIGFSGICIETPDIYTDLTTNQNNLLATRNFATSLINNGNKYIDNKGFKNINIENIINFIEQINVVPTNEYFNVNSIIRFIKNYKGTELRKWDVLFSSGSSNKEVDLVPGIIRHRCNMIKYSLNTEKTIARMSASKRRIGRIADAEFGISKEQIDFVKKKTNKKFPSQKDFFRYIKRNPLLIIYFIDLKHCNVGRQILNQDRNIEERFKNIPLIGFGIGFPSLSDVETKYCKFVLNKVAIEQMFSGEMDFNPEDE